LRTAVVLLAARPRRKRDPVNYLIGYHHVVQSLRRHHASIPEVVVMSPDLDETPAGADRLVRIDPRPFGVIRRTQSAFGRSVYFKLALFTLDYDRVIYLDTDLLIVGDIAELWDPTRYADRDLWGVRESAAIGLKHAVWQGKINAGMLLINRPLLGRPIFERLLSIAAAGRSYDSGDQGVLHEFLSDPEIAPRVGELDPAFNLPTCARVDGDWDRYGPTARILHYLGPRKPWCDAPPHRWHHPETQAIWDRETAAHPPVPLSLSEAGRPDLRTRLESGLLRAIRWPLSPFLDRG